jgi:uncharacterized protein (DUF1697 family)
LNKRLKPFKVERSIETKLVTTCFNREPSEVVEASEAAEDLVEEVGFQVVAAEVDSPVVVAEVCSPVVVEACSQVAEEVAEVVEVDPEGVVAVVDPEGVKEGGQRQLALCRTQMKWRTPIFLITRTWKSVRPQTIVFTTLEKTDWLCIL